MMRSQIHSNGDLCLACRLKLTDERALKQNSSLSISSTDVPATQHRCSCSKKSKVPPEELTERIEARAVQIDFFPYQRDFSNTDTGRQMSRPFLRPHASQHLERRSNNGARVEMNVMSGLHATTRPSLSTLGGSTGASDHSILPTVDEDYSPWHHPVPGGNGQRGASSTWRTSARAEISVRSLLHSRSDPSPRISDADNRQRYQPYTRPSPLLRYTQESGELQRGNFSDGLSPQTDIFLANDAEKNALVGVRHRSRDYSPPSPVLTLNNGDHRFLGFRDTLANISDHHRRAPPLTLDHEDRRLSSRRRPHRYEATSPDSEVHREGLLNRYQLPTPPGNSPLHPSPLPPNFRGFSDDHRPWRSRYDYPPREVSREWDHRDIRATPRNLRTPVSNSPVHKALLEDNYPNDRIPASNIADMSSGMADSARARNDGFTRHKVHRTYEDSGSPLRNSSYNDRVPRPSPNKKCAIASGSLSTPINDLSMREALFDSNYGNERFQASGVSIASMASDTPVHDGPHDRNQPDGSAYKPSSPPNIPQSIATLPVSGPKAVGASYSPPTSDDEEVDQLVENKPPPAPVYSRFQFMPGNTTSRTYKTVFYPSDKGPPISPWNARAMLALTDPDHSNVYTDIRRLGQLKRSSKADSLDTDAPGRMSELRFFYDSSMAETVQNSPYPRSLLFSNDDFFYQRAFEIQELPFPESNSVSSEVHDHIATFTLSSSTITNEATGSPELDFLADDLGLINLDPENDEPKA